MFRRSKSKVLVDCASEEDDMSWHHHHSYQDKDIEGEEEEEEAVPAVSKEAKVKKSKKERREKKMFSSKDDEHFLLSGVKLAAGRGAHKKIKDDEKEKEKKDKPEKGLCFWESITMTMRQISPTKKLEKMEGWEPPCLEASSETDSGTDQAPEDKSQLDHPPLTLPESLGLPLELASWAGRGLEEDSSRYANLSDSKDVTAAVRWTARAKIKLAGISRMSRGIVSESAWEGLK